MVRRCCGTVGLLDVWPLWRLSHVRSTLVLWQPILTWWCPTPLTLLVRGGKVLIRNGLCGKEDTWTLGWVRDTVGWVRDTVGWVRDTVGWVRGHLVG